MRKPFRHMQPGFTSKSAASNPSSVQTSPKVASKSGSTGEVVLSVLNRAMPASAVIHVGVGDGLGWMHQWRGWDVAQAWLINADGVRLTSQPNKLQPNTAQPNQAQWQILTAVVGESPGDVVFYQASNPEENGFIAADQLRGIWPNLKAVSEASRSVTTLDALIPTVDQNTDSANGVAAGAWLLIDCLPALPILKGGAELLNHVQVVVARVLFDLVQSDTQDSSPLISAASADAVTEFLLSQGFTLAETVSGHHPGIGHVVFIRPLSMSAVKELEQEKTANARLKKERDELSIEKNAMTVKLEEQKKTVIDRQAKIEEFSKSVQAENQKVKDLSEKLDGLSAQKALLEQEKTTLIAQQDVAAKKTGELEAQLATAVQEKTGLAKQRDELNQQLVGLKEQLQKADEAQQGLVQERDQLKDQLATAIKDKEAQVAQLNALNKEKQALTVQRDTLSKEKDSLVKEKEALAGEKNALAKERDALTGEKVAISGQLEEQKKVVVERQSKIDELTKLVQAEAQKVKELTARLDGVSDQKTVLEQEKSALVNKTEELTQQFAEIESRLSTVAKEKEALAGEKNALVKERDALSGEKSAVIGQLEGQKRVVAERQEKIDELTKLVQIETQKVKDLTVKFEGVTAEKAGLAQQRDDAVKKLVDVEAKVGVLSQEIGSHISYRDEISAQIQGFAEQVNLLKQAVEAAQAEKESLRQSLQQEHEAAKEALEGEHQGSVTGLEQRIESLNNELEAARVSISKLKTQNNELQHRQALMNEELVRADGQIHLIKDLLLSDKGV